MQNRTNTASFAAFRRAMLGIATASLVATSAPAVTASLPGGAVLVVPNPNIRTIKIELDNANGVEALLFRVQYNRSIAVATQVRGTCKVAGCAIEVNTSNPTNEVQISMACTSPLSGGGALFEIDFAGVNPGSTDLTFLECVLNEGSPGCQVVDGDLLVTSCALDVDASGAATANTDGAYIFRALPPTLQNIVPPAFRDLIPGIPDDDVILDNVNTVLPLLDVDNRGGALANTDGAYIFRALPPKLQNIVPPEFRALDPTIPSDAVIGANITAICP